MILSFLFPERTVTKRLPHFQPPDDCLDLLSYGQDHAHISGDKNFSALLLSKPSMKGSLLSTTSNFLDDFQEKQKDFCVLVREDWWSDVPPVVSRPACFPAKLVQIIPNLRLPLTWMLPLLLLHLSSSYPSLWRGTIQICVLHKRQFSLGLQFLCSGSLPGPS